jgi:opacity protein-like surface antigen
MNRPLLAAAMAVAATAAVAWTPIAGAQTTNRTPTATPTTGLRMPYQRDFWGYVGGSVGRSYIDVDCVGLNCDKRDVGFKLHAGGKFTNALGMEIGYVNLGQAQTAGGTHEAQGVSAVLLAGLPVGDRFSLFGKVGGVYSWTSVDTGVPGVATGDERGLDWTYGVGATLAVARNWELRLDWDRYQMDFATGERDADLYSIGVQYRF